MKTLKITTDSKISIIDLDFDHESLREEVGGYVELVRTQKLRDYFKTKVVMIVDEEGLVKNLPVNPMGCYFYDTDKHGNPIVTEYHMEQLGCEYVEVSWHAGARPSHSVWQGKVYKWNK